MFDKKNAFLSSCEMVQLKNRPTAADVSVSIKTQFKLPFARRQMDKRFTTFEMHSTPLTGENGAKKIFRC